MSPAPVERARAATATRAAFEKRVMEGSPCVPGGRPGARGRSRRASEPGLKAPFIVRSGIHAPPKWKTPRPYIRGGALPSGDRGSDRRHWGVGCRIAPTRRAAAYTPRAKFSATFAGQEPGGRGVDRRISDAGPRKCEPAGGNRLRLVAERAKLKIQEKLPHGASSTQRLSHLHDPISYARVTFDAPPGGCAFKVPPKNGIRQDYFPFLVEFDRRFPASVAKLSHSWRSEREMWRDFAASNQTKNSKFRRNVPRRRLREAHYAIRAAETLKK